MKTPRRTTTRVSLLVVGLLLGLALAGCGEEESSRAPEPELVPQRPQKRAVPPVTDAEKARFALDRVFRGPLPRTGRFRIPNLHRATLELAVADLVTLEPETLRLLADPAIVERATMAPRARRNPWHAVLDVLTRLEEPSEAILLAWTRPTIETGDATLMRRAVRALAARPGTAVGELLLAFVAARPGDANLAPLALRAIVKRGDASAAPALQLLYERGAGRSWATVADAIAGTRSPGNALAWFALLAESSGPQPSAFTTRAVEPAWGRASYIVADEVWPRRLDGFDVALQHDRVVVPGVLRDTLGQIPSRPDASAIVARGALEMDGTLPAASARCRLATVHGGGTAEASVRAEMGGADAPLDAIAQRCPLADAVEDEMDPAEYLEGILAQLEAGMVPESSLANAALDALRREGRSDVAVPMAVRVLEVARPQDAYQTLLFRAQDILGDLAPERLGAFFETASASEDPAEVEIAMILMRRRPQAAYGTLLETRLGALEDLELRDPLRRLLVWVMSRAPDVDKAVQAAFVPTLATWIDETPEPWASVLAPALLDLGPPGHRAFADGLRGERRESYLRALGQVRRIVSTSVAEALLDGIDAATPAAERQIAWAAAFRTAPAEAADAIAAAGERLDAADREEMRDVYEVVRHRATGAR